jgi:long-subunit acyl-CoA synthetase (AMP-forming)
VEWILSDSGFHSGDIGTIDENGFVAITGRKKEILVTAGGKNVAPAVLEDRINAHSLISMSMVVGDAKPYIACLVTIDPEVFPKWNGADGSLCRWPGLHPQQGIAPATGADRASWRCRSAPVAGVCTRNRR